MKTTLFLSSVILLITGTSFISPGYRIGDYASDFTLKNIKGESVSLSRMDNTKGYILVFTCNTCPDVKKYEQRIIDLHTEFSGQGFPVIAINSNDPALSPGDSFEEMLKIATEKNYPFEYLFDESQEIAREYGATSTPQVFVLSKNNSHLSIEYSGAIDNNANDEARADKHYVRDAVTALLKGYEIPVTLTKAAGCSLKWKSPTSSK
jgi:peroxiredoxin